MTQLGTRKPSIAAVQSAGLDEFARTYPKAKVDSVLAKHLIVTLSKKVDFSFVYSTHFFLSCSLSNLFAFHPAGRVLNAVRTFPSIIHLPICYPPVATHYTVPIFHVS